MNALDPTVAEFRERLKHQRTEKKRRLNAMNCKPENSRVLGRFWYASAIFAALLGNIRAPRSKAKSLEKFASPQSFSPRQNASPPDGPVRQLAETAALDLVGNPLRLPPTPSKVKSGENLRGIRRCDRARRGQDYGCPVALGRPIAGPYDGD